MTNVPTGVPTEPIASPDSDDEQASTPAPERDGTGSGRLSPPGLDDDMDFERRNPGSGGETP